MKVYVALKHSGKIAAWSTSETLVKSFVDGLSKEKRKKVVIDSMYLTPVEEKEMKERYGNKEIRVTEFLGDVVTPENEEVYAMAQEEYDKLQFLIKDLNHIINNYSLHKDDKKILRSSLKLLKDISKKKNFNRVTGFSLIRELEDDGKLNLLKRVFNIGGRRE